MIEQRRAEDAQEFNMTHAEILGTLKGTEIFTKRKIERLKAIAFLDKKGTIAERNAQTELDAEVIKAGNEYADIVAEATTIKLRMDAQDSLIRIWQTQEATLRKGV